MRDQQLADHFDLGIKDLHTKIDALPDGAIKRRATRLASILHRAAEELAELAANEKRITPFSGGEKLPGG